MKKYISVIIGVVLLIVAVALAILFIQSKSKKKPKPIKTEKVVFVETVKNGNVPIKITASGSLIAKYKIELFSEVQGILNSNTKEFKPGTYYKKGERLLSINSEELYHNVQSLKSNLLNVIISMMPDFKVEFPNEYEKWQTYLSEFDLNKTTQKLPEINSDKEKYFLSFRNVFTTYYNVKNIETRLNKYSISAPFSGVLTEANVTTGTLIRQGQKLGEFINPKVYELGISVNAEFGQFLKVGNEVSVTNLNNTKKWNGKVIRINGKVDLTSQTVKVFILVKGDGLKEGIFLDASLNATSVENGVEISRKLIVGDNQIFIVRDSTLQLQQITPVHFNEKSVVVKGLKEDTKILSKPVPGAYFGMKIKINNIK
ncbi:MAG: HlyD family efflux transporter periplasmic adaptor subunit [Melioribacteraceae bacterium]